MNPTLEEQRDELADEFIKSWRKVDAFFAPTELCMVDLHYTYAAGFNAAIKLLTEAAGEFDSGAAKDQYTKCYVGDGLDWLRLTRWQHSQDAARIGLTDLKFSSAKAWIKELETRMSEWQGKFEEAADKCLEFATKYNLATDKALAYQSTCDTFAKERDKYKAALERIVAKAPSAGYVCEDIAREALKVEK